MPVARRTLLRLALVLVAVLAAACKKNSGPTESSPYFIITIDPATPVVAVGQQVTLKARITGPGSLTQTFVWTSLTPDVVFVNAGGVVNALTEGTGRIRVAWGLDQDVFTEVEVLVTAVPVEDEQLDRRDSPPARPGRGAAAPPIGF